MIDFINFFKSILTKLNFQNSDETTTYKGIVFSLDLTWLLNKIILWRKKK